MLLMNGRETHPHGDRRSMNKASDQKRNGDDSSSVSPHSGNSMTDISHKLTLKEMGRDIYQIESVHKRSPVMAKGK